MKKKKYFLLLILIIPFRVNALNYIVPIQDANQNVDYYSSSGMSGITRGNLYTCTGWNGPCTLINQAYSMSLYNMNSNISTSYSVVSNFALDKYLQKDVVYSASVDFCTNGTISSTGDMQFRSGGVGAEFDDGLTSIISAYYGLNDISFINSSRNVYLTNKCYRFYSIIKPSYNLGALKFYLYGKNRNLTNYALIGFNVEYIGESSDVSMSSINNAINSSTNSINNNINQMNDNIKKEIQEGTDKVNNTITDSSVDSDEISSLGGTDLPTNGALSAILNMPVQFFSTLLNQLDASTCKSSTIPLPYVDYSFELTCGRSLLNDLGALDFYELIGTLAGGLAIFNYLIYMGKQMKKMQDLEDGGGVFGGI